MAIILYYRESHNLSIYDPIYIEPHTVRQAYAMARRPKRDSLTRDHVSVPNVELLTRQNRRDLT
jgi:hypothetical protein